MDGWSRDNSRRRVLRRFPRVKPRRFGTDADSRTDSGGRRRFPGSLSRLRRMQGTRRGSEMRLVRTGVYRCTICDDIIFVPAQVQPRASFVDTGRGCTERVITARDAEVHRCVYAAAGHQGNDNRPSATSGLTLFEHRRTRLLAPWPE